jgi:uncharacterized protein with HEPN domain
MDEQVLKYIYDAVQAANKIVHFVEGKSFEEYNRDDFLRSAVERQFEILGEALNRIKKIDQAVMDAIKGYRGAISFRNVLAHGYDMVDNVVVWGIIEKDLPKLKESLDELMRKE